MNQYRYKMLPFWIPTYILSWGCWFLSAYFSRQAGSGDTYTVWMALGLFAPALIGLALVLASKNAAMRRDYAGKLFDMKRIRPLSILWMILAVLGSILVSICISLLFGQSTDQFAFTEGFSFSVGAVPTLFTLLLAAFVEEVAWRGYGFDSFTRKNNAFKATCFFSIVWTLWHFPLFFITGSYQYEILQMNPWYAVNFFASGIPITFLFTWLCIKNNRSVFACFLFHFLLNFMQETINMTQVTKCIETVVIALVAAIIVLADKNLFFQNPAPETFEATHN